MLKKILVLVFFVVFYSTRVFAENTFLQPYTGLDIGVTNYSFKSGFGDNAFKKHYPKINFYVGTKINDLLAVEAGVERTSNKKNNTTINNGEMLLGRTIGGGGPYGIETKAKITGWHIGFSGNYPLIENQFSLIGNVGLKRTTSTLLLNYLTAAGAPITGRTELAQTKTLARLSAGVQYFFSEHVGLRALANWENSSKLKPTGISSTGALYEANFKNSLGYSLGIVIR